MRVDQVITLVWAGNVALLGGSGWAGWTFWQQKLAQREVPKIAWPEAESQPINMTRWPGSVQGFRNIWDTPLNGPVPPPEVPKDTGPVKPEEPDVAFRARIKIDKAIWSPEAGSTILVVTDGGQPRQLQVGACIDEWQLTSVKIDFTNGAAVACFHNPRLSKNGGDLEITQDLPDLKEPAFAPGAPRPITPQDTDQFHKGAGKLLPGDPVAYIDRATGEWIVPEAEALYWEGDGLKDIIAQTRFTERPNGLEVASMPPRGPLPNTRGVTQGDLIVSINGAPIRSLEDVYRYFRGDGKGLRRYEVVIERDGARRTQIYNVARRR